MANSNHKKIALNQTYSLPVTSSEKSRENESVDQQSWSFGNVARAVGCGVTAFGSGVVHGSKAVKSGVVNGSVAVGTGVIHGTKAAGKATIAAGKSVCQAGEVVGNAAVTGVTVIGSSTVQAGKAVTNASVNVVSDTTKWVREQAESIHEDQIHTVLPGETLEDISMLYDLDERYIIKLNSLESRGLTPGTKLIVSREVEDLCDVYHTKDYIALEDVTVNNLKCSLKLTSDAITLKSLQGETLYDKSLTAVKKITVKRQNTDSIPSLISLQESELNYPLEEAEEYQDHFEGDVLTIKAPGTNEYRAILSSLNLWHPDLLKDKQNSIYELSNSDTDSTGSLQSCGEFLSLQRSLRKHLPIEYRDKKLSLLFSTEMDGFSLLNLYRKIGDFEPPVLIIIQDMANAYFGAFVTATPQITDEFQGDGRSWLFFSEQDDKEVVVSRWTGLNEYFMKGNIDSMCFGADDGKFGIYIDGNLHKGRIEKCTTFQGWPKKEMDFQVRLLSCFGFENADCVTK